MDEMDNRIARVANGSRVPAMEAQRTDTAPIPLRAIPELAARGDADFEQEFVRWSDVAMTVPLSLAGWTFRLVVKKDAFAPGALLEATTANGGIVVLDEAGGRLAARFDKAALAGALTADGADRLEGLYALQAAGPGGADEVWAAGPFVLRAA